MKRNLLNGLLLVPSLLLGQAADSALIDHGSYVTDTLAGLDWLKLTATYNRSYDDVSGKLGPGQEFDGWAYATGAQFEALLLNQGAVTMSCANGTLFCGWSTDNNGIAAPLINLLGDTGEQQLNGVQTAGLTVWTVGILADAYDASSQWEGELYDYDFNALAATEDNISTHDTFIDRAALPAYGGSFLVRATTVPVPAAMWLFGSGLLALVATVRRRQGRQ